MMREFWGSAQAPEFFALVQGWLGHAGGGERFRSPLILASGSALGSLSGVALSSVRLLAAPRDGLGANFLNRDVKMEYSRDLVPLDPKLVSVLKDWRQRAPLKGDTAMPSIKRKANSKVVSMVLRKQKRKAKATAS
jgi:hypothetical protein